VYALNPFTLDSEVVAFNAEYTMQVVEQTGMRTCLNPALNVFVYVV
jgi:hypothetical protein